MKLISWIMRAKDKTILSAFLVAMVFGVISPKIKIMSVTKPVAKATPIPSLPKMEMTNDVVNEEAPILTKLLPTKIDERTRSLWSSSFCTICARLFPSSSAKVLIRI